MSLQPNDRVSLDNPVIVDEGGTDVEGAEFVPENTVEIHNGQATIIGADIPGFYTVNHDEHGELCIHESHMTKI